MRDETWMRPSTARIVVVVVVVASVQLERAVFLHSLLRRIQRKHNTIHVVTKTNYWFDTIEFMKKTLNRFSYHIF